MIDSKPLLKAQFEAIRADLFELEKDSSFKKDPLTKKRIHTEDYENLSYVRHNFGFHYNHEGNGAETKKALDAYAARCAELRTPEKALLLIDNENKDIRFPIADEVVKVAMALGANVKLSR